MHILYISGNVTLPDEPGARRPWHHAEFWVRHGHQVTVVSGNRLYLTDEARSFAKNLISSVSCFGIPVLFVATFPGRHQSMPGRLLYYASLLFLTFFAGLRARNVDLVYVRSLPPGLPMIGWLLSLLHRAPMALAIPDLHPETAVAAGMVASTPLVKIWEAFENYFRRYAVLLVAHAPEIGDKLLAKGFAPDKVIPVSHAWQPRIHDPSRIPVEAHPALGLIDGHFSVVYAGALSRVMALHTILDACFLLQTRLPQAVFLLLGGGDQKQALVEKSKEFGITNLHLLDPIPQTALASVLVRSTILVSSASISWSDRLGGSLTNKFFDYLGASRPVLYAGSGAFADHVRSARCGLVIPPEDPPAMADAIEYLYRNSEELDAMGKRGFDYLSAHFHEEEVFGALETRLMDI